MVSALTELLSNPLVWKILVGYWILSALISAMPSPAQLPAQLQKNVWFIFFYGIAFGFLHVFAGSLNRAAIAFKVPGAENGNGSPKPPAPPAGG